MPRIFGGLIVLWFVLAVIWIGFLIWAGVNIVNWLMTK